MKNIISVVAIILFGYGCVPQSPPVQIEQCDVVNYPSTTPATAPLFVEGQYFKDNDGRTVMLRGINTAGSSKVPDFMPINDSALLDPLPGWGFNTLRLLFTWEAFEGTRCSFDESYLAYYEQVVAWAAERDMYVIVDFHQDAYSRFALQGCGEGFPQWSMSSSIAPVAPDNGANCESWGTQMAFDFNNQTLWDDFHTNREGAKGAYLDMLEAVAHRMSGHPNVIGYDIINEPWGSDSQLLSLFESAATTIRSHHPDAVLFVPSHALVSGGATNTMSKPNITNFAYSPHYYDQSVFVFKEYQGNDIGIPLDTIKQKSVAWDVPMFLGEYGAPEPTIGLVDYMDAVYDWLDQRFVSGAQWNYAPDWNAIDKDGWNVEDLSIVDDSGQLRDTYSPRPYPQKTAGMPVGFSVDDNGLSYQWNNVPTAGVAGTTEIFLPLDYAIGKTLTIASNSATGCSISGQKLSCEIVDSGVVTVTLEVP